MQSKEAIGMIMFVKNVYISSFNKECHEALALGIKALEEREKRLKLIDRQKHMLANTDDMVDRLQAHSMISALEGCEYSD